MPSTRRGCEDVRLFTFYFGFFFPTRKIKEEERHSCLKVWKVDISTGNKDELTSAGPHRNSH